MADIRLTDIKVPGRTDKNYVNTTKSSDTSSKIYLIGGTDQSANPDTYSDNEVYATNGTLTSKNLNVTDKTTTKSNLEVSGVTIKTWTLSDWEK